MKSTLLWLLALTMLLATGCKKDKKLAYNTKVFSVALFKSNLQSQLGTALGYAFVINKNGLLADTASFGIGGVNPAGGSNIPASVEYDINIASVTKAFTGMAAIKIMDAKGIDVDDQIGVWLPSYWQKHSNFNTITFRELLTHTSGITQSSTTWDSLKATATRNPGAKSFVYANANFALFRALIPKMNDLTGFNNLESNSTGFETWMSNQYIGLMQSNLFTPAGLPAIICNVDGSKNTMQGMNELNNPPLLPRTTGDWTQTCGGGGYYMTTLEMAQVMAYLAHSQNILTTTQKTKMDSGLLGWDNNDSFSTPYGQVYGKDGALFWDNNSDNTTNTGDSGLQTWVGKFPNGVELSMSVTSIGNGFRSMSTVARNAYEAAWVNE